MYSTKLMELYHNAIHRGEIEHPTLIIDATSQSCGDHIIITMTLEKNCITGIKHCGQGSVLGFVVAELLCRQVIGKLTHEALNVSAATLLKELDIELGPTRLRTLHFIFDTFHKGLLDHAQS